MSKKILYMVLAKEDNSKEAFKHFPFENAK